MGAIIHQAVVVTACDPWAKTAHTKAVRLCGKDHVTELGPALTNGFRSFLVIPDGSKEGWIESDVGAEHREAFVNWLNRQRYGDGSSPYDWVLVEYGERYVGKGAVVLDHTGRRKPSDRWKGPADLRLGRT
jgi:hypothetical protein